MSPSDKTVDLEPKARPRQKRAIETYERLLDVAAQLLEDVGVERISTNLIAEKAGVTPPSLYRYFPNKYAVLRALGDRLMEQQNDIMMDWLDQADASGGNKAAFLEQSADLLQKTLDVTLAHPGALAIMRSLRAVPAVQQVRLDSHRKVTDAWVDALQKTFPDIPRETLWAKARMTVELGYAAIEMAMEEDMLSPETILREASESNRKYWEEFLPD